MESGNTLVLTNTFKGLQGVNLEELRAVAQRKSYPPGVVLCQQGRIEHTFYVIVEGRVVVTQKLDNGQDRILNILGKNEYFGEMGLIDDTPRMATCTTILPTTVLEITEELFDKLVEESHTIALAMTRRLLSHLRDLDKRTIEELTAKNEALEKAYTELKQAQDKLVEQERLERELELAAHMQRHLLPAKLPQYPSFAFAAYLKPARHVGGDFYDVIELDDNHVGILIADVADKGFHAALFMAVGRTLFRGESRNQLSPAETALAVHRAMMEIATTTDVFVTVFYGVLHRPTGLLKYVRAGHERPLLFRPGQPVQELPGKGRFLGMIPELELQEYDLQLQPGDRLLMYSDGVPDATNPQEEQYGHEQLLDLFQLAGTLHADDIVHHVADGVAQWCGTAAPFDDLTLLVLEAKNA